MKKLAVLLIVGMLAAHELCLVVARGMASAAWIGYASGSAAECVEVGLVAGEALGEAAAAWCLVGVKMKKKGLRFDKGLIEDRAYEACMKGALAE